MTETAAPQAAPDLKDEVRQMVVSRIVQKYKAHIEKGLLEDTKMEFFAGELADRLVAEFEAHFYGRIVREDVQEVKGYPDGIWQAIRKRWAPLWWLAKYPVRETQIKMVTNVWALCPHVQGSDRQKHMDFLVPLKPDQMDHLAFAVNQIRKIRLKCNEVVQRAAHGMVNDREIKLLVRMCDEALGEKPVMIR